jgi:N utilization substance protein B
MAAVQVLFELDFQDRVPDAIIDERLAENKLSEANQQFVRDLVHGVLHHKEEIDRRIADLAPQWPLDQIARVDKNIMRLAIYELMSEDSSTPAKVAITEAVELARMLGSATSPGFVNGVLGAVVGKDLAQKGR